MRTVVPCTTWRPLTLLTGSPVFSPCASHWRYLATPTGRYHSRTLIRPSTPACATPARVHVDQFWIISFDVRLGWFLMQPVSRCSCCRKMSHISDQSHRSRAGFPSMRKHASSETISYSVELSETDVCFLHIQLMGTYV